MSRSRAGPSRLIHGRRHGKKLRPERRALIERLLPELRVVVPQRGALDTRALFDPPVNEIWLEVGFGAGEHLAAQARVHPDIGMIGCEPFVNGVASLLATVAAEDLRNVRVLDDDARPLLEALPEAAIGRLFVLFPDPWPTRRHHTRRFVTRANLDTCARILRDGGEQRIATDHDEHCRWILDHLRHHGAFEWLARRPGDWRARPDDWPATRYESKARAQGRQPVYLRYRRVPRG